MQPAPFCLPELQQRWHIVKGWETPSPSLPELQIHSELQIQQKIKVSRSGILATSETQPSHSTPDPRTSISFWDVTATQLQEGNGHSHCNSLPWLHLSRQQRQAGWSEQGSSKAKPEDASKWQILRKRKFTSFWLVIERSTKLFCTERREMTALPEHHVAPAKAVTHGTGASSHQQMTGSNTAMPQSNLQTPREYLNVIIWAFSLVLQEGKRTKPLLPPAIKTAFKRNPLQSILGNEGSS